MTTVKTDYVNEYVLFFNKDFVIADSYTVIESGLSEFKKDQSITHAELNQYMNDTKDFKLETIRVLPELSLT
tara:strand:- start:544 stop:759 length:216 start_codon:yes stop_codon:yes gene_type:complete